MACQMTTRETRTTKSLSFDGVSWLAVKWEVLRGFRIHSDYRERLVKIFRTAYFWCINLLSPKIAHLCNADVLSALSCFTSNEVEHQVFC